MPSFTAPAKARVKMRVRVDKRPYLAGLQDPPNNSTWENVKPHTDGMGEDREFVMPSNHGDVVSFNGQFDEHIGQNDPDPSATYTVTFSAGGLEIGHDTIVVPQGAGPVARQYSFTAS